MTYRFTRDFLVTAAVLSIAMFGPLAFVGGAQAPNSSRVGAGPMDGNSLLFLPAVSYRPYGLTSDSLAIGDLNGDGWPDLVVAHYGNGQNGSPGSVSVLLGNGDGTFQPAVHYRSRGLQALSVAIGDINGDGYPDVLVANFCATEGHCFDEDGVVGVLMGNGDGTFKAAWDDNPDLIGLTSLALADLNGDGFPDLLVVNHDGTVAVQLNGAGYFHWATLYQLGAGSIAVADVNGDGKPDLLATTACGDISCVSVLLGNGDGSFQNPQSFSTGGNALRLAVADVNLDGKPDLVVTTYCGSGNCNGETGSVNVLLGNGDGTFQPAVSYITNDGSNAVAVADINGDGKPDLVVAAIQNNAVGVMLGNGDGTFQPVQHYFAGGYLPAQLAVLDVNGDGQPDVAVVNEVSNNVAVLLNNSNAPTTTTSLTSNTNSAGSNRAVTYTANVTSQSGETLSGTVEFVDSFGTGATVPLTNNQATFTKTYPKSLIGVHSITALYSGVLHKAAGSTSAALTEFVRGPSLTVLATSGTPSHSGQAVTFTATVTSQYGAIPDGEIVALYDGKTLLDSVAMAGGQAVYTTSTLSVKRHAITATYVGDNSFLPSEGAATQIVEK